METLRHNRNFRLLFSASAVTNLGDGVSVLAFPWLATLITQDPILIAAIAAAGRLPWLLLSLPAGVFIDRHDRRSLIIQADVVRFFLTIGVLSIALRVARDGPGDQGPVMAMICIGLAFLLGTAEVLRDNAAQTLLPDIVASDALERANGTLWTIEEVMGRFIGPPLAGGLIALSIPAPFALDMLSFGVAAWAVWRMDVPRRVVTTQGRFWADLRLGVRWIWHATVIRRLALVLGVTNAVLTMTLTLMVLLAQDVLGLDAGQYGVLLTTMAIGGVAGAQAGPWIVRQIGAQAAMLIALCVIPVPLLIMALSSSPVLIGMALILEGAAGSLWNIVTVSYRQRHIPTDLLGRVNAIYRMVGWGAMPIGAMIGGLIVGWSEPELGREAALRLPYFGGAVVLGLTALYGLARLRLHEKGPLN